jgi:hypothetical protein
LDKLDSIVNRLPLLGDSNRKLSDREPADYFEELRHNAVRTGTLGDLRRRLQDAMIPGALDSDQWLNQFSIERYDDFLAARANLLVERVRELIGDSLVISEPTPDMAAEED